MTIRKISSVHCDFGLASRLRDPERECEGWIAEERHADAARRVARAHGWKRIDGRDCCPLCAETLGEQ